MIIDLGKKRKTIEVGPIWNQMDAERKCHEAARSTGAIWTGQWSTTTPSRMSVSENPEVISGRQPVPIAYGRH